MSIAEHVHSLQQHLAQYGLYPVPVNAEDSEVFKICFLNKYEMERWKAMREREAENEATQKVKIDTNHHLFS